MSKPLGMTADFRITHPDRVEDKVWEAVEEAIDAGWTPERFMREVRSDWSAYLAQKRKDDDRSFERGTL